MICYVIAQANSRRRLDPLRFHPIRKRLKLVSEARMVKWMEEVSARLPDVLSEEQVFLRWEQYCHDADGARKR